MHLRALFIYGSSEGHTSKITHYLEQQARNLGCDTRLINISSLKDITNLTYLLAKTDCIIIGASVHLGQHQSKVKRFLKEYAYLIKNKPTIFFSVSLMAASTRAEDRELARQQAQQLVAAHNSTPEHVWTVPGALQYTRYNWMTRLFMKWMVKKHHGDTDTSRDYVYTDWVELEKKLGHFLKAVAMMQVTHSQLEESRDKELERCL